MSRLYDLYLEDHKENVRKGFYWIKNNIPEILDSISKDVDIEHQICFAHDESKTELDEYEAYDNYFYGGNRSYSVVENFNLAWMRHIHRNPHHWQHWILINDDQEEGIKTLYIPINYILEMICDWWSFSWKSGNLYEIFTWYENHKNYISLNESSRYMVEYILGLIKEKLDMAKQQTSI